MPYKAISSASRPPKPDLLKGEKKYEKNLAKSCKNGKNNPIVVEYRENDHGISRDICE